MNDVLELFITFSRLGLQAFGGAIGILPEMQREVVDIHGWLPASEFVEAYAVGQLSPGPNMLVTFFIGYRVAGVAGALAAGFGMFLPTALLTVIAASFLTRAGDHPWARAVQRGLAPIALGLMASGVVTLVRTGIPDVRSGVIAACSLALLMTGKLNPALIVAMAGILGLILPHFGI